MPRIAVVGTGYVGLTTGACLAHLGHSVVCLDIDAHKVSLLENGVIPFLEDGLSELVEEGLARHELSFSTDVVGATADAEFVFLCLPTPQAADGDANLDFVVDAARSIGPVLRSDAVVINKSTVPVGTTRVVQNVILRSDIHVVSNPEFLREGTAVKNFLKPDRIVVGADNSSAGRRVANLYQKIDAPVVLTDAASAEMIKYAANAFLATKLSFINAVAAICEGVGADISDVVTGVGYDRRIGHDFMSPSPGWGGSCLPKDTSALIKMASRAGYEFDLLKAVVESNRVQFDRTATQIANRLSFGDTVAVWGLTFKAQTDDLRDSPALEVVRRLVDRGLRVVAFDPTVSDSLLELPGLEIEDSEEAACKGASVLAVLTEWNQFLAVDPLNIGEVMQTKRVVDGRNLLDVEKWVRAGFEIQGVGRASRSSSERS